MNLWGKEVPNPPVSSDVRRIKQFVCSWYVLREFLTSLSSSSFDSSFVARFDSFLLHDLDQWRELRLSTEGFASIPHDIIDRGESRARVRFWGIFVFLWFPIDRLQFGQWFLGNSSPTPFVILCAKFANNSWSFDRVFNRFCGRRPSCSPVPERSVPVGCSSYRELAREADQLTSAVRFLKQGSSRRSSVSPGSRAPLLRTGFASPRRQAAPCSARCESR
jgi:hypothetical protein